MHGKGIYHTIAGILNCKEGYEIYYKVKSIVKNDNDLANRVDKDGFTPILRYIQNFSFLGDMV